MKVRNDHMSINSCVDRPKRFGILHLCPPLSILYAVLSKIVTSRHWLAPSSPLVFQENSCEVNAYHCQLFREKQAERAAMEARTRAEDEMRLQATLKQEAEADLRDQTAKTQKKRDAMKHRLIQELEPCYAIALSLSLERAVESLRLNSACALCLRTRDMLC